jgi:DNA-binding HxlR family transcriptional regulator
MKQLNRFGEQTCPIARALSVVGDGWTLMILHELFLASRRFEDIRAHTGISPHLLSGRLEGLVEAGIIKRVAYDSRPPRYEFKLTAKGRDLWPVMIALKQWGEAHMGEGDEHLLDLVHDGCGHAAPLEMVCTHCDQPTNALSTRVVMSPAMAKDRAERQAENAQPQLRRRRLADASGNKAGA